MQQQKPLFLSNSSKSADPARRPSSSGWIADHLQPPSHPPALHPPSSWPSFRSPSRLRSSSAVVATRLLHPADPARLHLARRHPFVSRTPSIKICPSRSSKSCRQLRRPSRRSCRVGLLPPSASPIAKPWLVFFASRPFAHRGSRRGFAQTCSSSSPPRAHPPVAEAVSAASSSRQAADVLHWISPSRLVVRPSGRRHPRGLRAGLPPPFAAVVAALRPACHCLPRVAAHLRQPQPLHSADLAHISRRASIHAWPQLPVRRGAALCGFLLPRPPVVIFHAASSARHHPSRLVVARQAAIAAVPLRGSLPHVEPQSRPSSPAARHRPRRGPISALLHRIGPPPIALPFRLEDRLSS
uniref:Uncharacterized protein n=1 Tax=Arundo donax TaxID=35708 RepID=A0A0A9HP66_ARUDO